MWIHKIHKYNFGKKRNKYNNLIASVYKSREACRRGT